MIHFFNYHSAPLGEQEDVSGCCNHNTKDFTVRGQNSVSTHNDIQITYEYPTEQLITLGSNKQVQTRLGTRCTSTERFVHIHNHFLCYAAQKIWLTKFGMYVSLKTSL